MELGRLIFISLVLWPAFNCGAAGLDLNRLSAEYIKKVEGVMAKLSLLISERQVKRDLAVLTMEELYTPLDSSEAAFLKQFENLDANELGVKIPRRVAAGNPRLIVIKGQKVRDKKKMVVLEPKYLPEDVYQSYMKMMDAMQKDIGKRLYVESGYRSEAYQLYVFMRSLKGHGYSIRETAKSVALPRYSEHADSEHQAIDFISEDGIGCQSKVKKYESLAEYSWLVANAKRFGFVLSYPKDSGEGITFEPWHWRYEKELLRQAQTNK